MGIPICTYTVLSAFKVGIKVYVNTAMQVGKYLINDINACIYVCWNLGHVFTSKSEVMHLVWKRSIERLRRHSCTLTSHNMQVQNWKNCTNGMFRRTVELKANNCFEYVICSDFYYIWFHLHHTMVSRTIFQYSISNRHFSTRISLPLPISHLAMAVRTMTRVSTVYEYRGHCRLSSLYKYLCASSGGCRK